MQQDPSIWISEDVAGQLGLKHEGPPFKIMPLKELVYEVLRDGEPNDIIVLPFFRKFSELLNHIRERGINGPVLIYTKEEIMPMNLLDLASEGVVFMDSSRFSRLMITGFINFLFRTQKDHVRSRVSARDKGPRAARPPQNPEEIEDLFRVVMKKRTRIVLSCQFRENLPTLNVSCELIEMVGEIESKIILDKFNPEEFTGLYKQMGKGAPLTGFIATDNESMGFQLKLASPIHAGRLTVFLPDFVYEQKRKFFRVEPDPKQPVKLHILPENDPSKSFLVQDISEGGFGLKTPYKNLEKEITYPFALDLPQKGIILGRASVVFKGDQGADMIDYGLEISLHNADLQQLRHYVFKRQAGILAAIRDLSL
ncbi:MAG: PilZ domain-containing protein [Thermodesulfobacteriota bacterium]|nr:PilZ domain-containing protein [Thermodesulfobacteriota bacterium]